MKKLFLVSAVICCVFAAFAATLTEQEIVDNFSYFLGANSFYGYSNAYGIDAQKFAQGALDLANGKFTLTEDDMQKIIQDYNEHFSAKMKKENLAYAESFLAQNKKNKDVVTTKSGLQYKITKKGTGTKAKTTDSVSVYYTLTTPDGTVVDQVASPKDPVTFALSDVVPGFREACTVAPVGSKLTAWIHPNLGYGENGAGSSIEPNMLLTFDIEIVSIK